MAVRCAGCGQQVSEWAARCPHCGRSLDDAELIPEPAAASDQPQPATSTGTGTGTGTATPPDNPAALAPALTPAEPPPTPAAGLPGGAPPLVSRPYSSRTLVRALAGVAIGGLVAGAFLLNRSGPSNPKPSAGPASSVQKPITPVTTAPSPSGPARSRLRAARAPAFPTSLAIERLFFAEPAQTGFYQADGNVVTRFEHSPGIGDQPLISGDGVVVYLHGLDAYRTSGESAAHLVDLGPASWIFPAQRGAIGIESGGGSQPTFVEYMAADGAMPAPGSIKVRLPSDLTAVAQVPSGLLVTTGAISAPYPSPLDHLRLSLIKAHSRIALGPAAAVIGTHGALAAWTICRSSRCSLRLFDTTTGRGRTIQPPDNYHGYALGGAFSPDGSRLATFAPANGKYASNAIRLVVVSVRSGQPSLVGPPLFAGPGLFGEATWSRDGDWLYFGGLAGPLEAQQMARTGPHGTPWVLSLDTSFAVSGD